MTVIVGVAAVLIGLWTSTARAQWRVYDVPRDSREGGSLPSRAPRTVCDTASDSAIADLWFETAESLRAALKSAEMQAASADVANFATGGVTLYSQQETPILGNAES